MPAEAVTGMLHEAGAFGVDPLGLTGIALVIVIVVVAYLICYMCIRKWFRRRLKRGHKSLSK